MIVKGTGYDVNFFMNIRPAKNTESVKGDAPCAKAGELFSESLRGKTDTIEISKQPEENSAFLSEVKGKLLDAIGQNVGSDRLESLKSSVAAGSYTVDADEMAQILSE